MVVDLSAADRTVVEFAAAHDLVLSSQLRRVVDEDAGASDARVGRLVSEGLLAPAPRLRVQRGAYQITTAGLRQLGSDLLVPVLDLRGYWEQLGLAWLWVAASRGAFGPVEAIYSQRAMRAADLGGGVVIDDGRLSAAVRAKLADASFAVAAGGGVRYPGLVLVVPQGRVAMELVMAVPSQAWFDDVLTGYAAKAPVAVAVLVATGEPLRRRLLAEIDRRGLSDRVQAQTATFLFDSG